MVQGFCNNSLKAKWRKTAVAYKECCLGSTHPKAAWHPNFEIVLNIHLNLLICHDVLRLYNCL